jgi:fumarate hydratase class II
LVSYVLREVPIGIEATGTRRERDPLGPIDVPADRYWGASTQRVLKAAPGSSDGMPERFFRCYGYIKRAAAMMNAQAGRLPSWKSAAIVRATDDLIAGLLADQFPLSIWQSGSGRDADTNVNEVLANRAAQLLGGAIGIRMPIDPTRDVNMGQSLGIAFTASMFIATVVEVEEVLVPRCSALARAIERNPSQSSGHGHRLRAALGRLDEAEGGLHEIGGDLGDQGITPEMTAEDWEIVVGIMAVDTARPFIVAPGGFSDRASVDVMVAAMAATRGLAIVLLDLVDAIRTSRNVGDQTEIQAHIEAIAMICRYVIGQDQVMAAAVCGYNAAACMARPLIVVSVLNCLRRLGEGCEMMRRIVSRTR